MKSTKDFRGATILVTKLASQELVTDKKFNLQNIYIVWGLKTFHMRTESREADTPKY